MSAAYDLTMIRQTLGTLHPPGTVAELRVLDTGRTGTVSGYFDDPDAMSDAAVRWSGQAPGVYTTLNPCVPALLARAANRLEERAKQTTSDADILRRDWLPIDFDPVRPAGISSTDAEHTMALQRAETCRAWFHALGWPAPVLADSGNGAHLLYRIDLENDDASRTLVKRCLEAIALYCSDEAVHVDLTTFNAARIWKVYGTMACKGDSLPDRPYRLARLLDVPQDLICVTRAQLEALAALVPEPPQPAPRSVPGTRFGGSTYGAFDLPQWIATHGLPVGSPSPWQGGTRWVLNPCPWNSAHTNKSAFIAQFPSGAIAAGCHHNGCSGNNWHALRDLYEPGWRVQRDAYQQRQGQGAGTLNALNALNAQGVLTDTTWPTCDPQAYHGLAGEIVRAIAPHTESDPVALLIQTLVMTGSSIGRVPYFAVEADRHYPNLFACLVGASSKGRKGTSAGYAKRLVTTADHAWESRLAGGLSSGEGVIWNVRDAVYGLDKKGEEVCLDEGVEDKRLCILETEFARALAKTSQEGNVLSAVLRQAWDHGDLRTLVSGRQKAPVVATGAHISVVAHITAEELQRLLTDTEAANGFGNRFLWVCVKRAQLLPDGGEYPTAALQPLQRNLTQAILHARIVTRMRRTPAAQARWREIYTALAEETPGLLGAITARAEAQVLRLSMLYALLERQDSIDVPHLEAAYALWRYCEDSARYVFGTLLGDPLADELLRMLRDSAPDGMARTEIYNAFGRHQRGAAIGQALALLQRAGLARREVEQTPGRPIERWFACALRDTCAKSAKSVLSPSSAPLNTHNALNAQPPPVEKRGERELYALSTLA